MFIHINMKGRKLVISLALTFVCIGIFAGIRLTGDDRSMETVSGNWGLSFQEEGVCPVGNATPQELKEMNAYFCDTSGKKTIFLTFDAGYENGYTPEILDVLKKEKVTAAFFVCGTYIRDNGDLIKRMESEGHIVGNHTMTHPDMSAIDNLDAFKNEIEGVEKVYKKITGKKMKKFYRPPQGKYSEKNLLNAVKLGYTTVFWSLAYVDWLVDKQPDEAEAFDKLLPRTHRGAIVLLHSTSKTNARILEKLITKWKEEGYQFCSLEKLGKL